MRLVIELVLGPGHLGQENELFPPESLRISQSGKVKKQTSKRSVAWNFGLRVPHGACSRKDPLPGMGWTRVVREEASRLSHYSSSEWYKTSQRRRPPSDRSYGVCEWVGESGKASLAWLLLRLLEPGWRILLGPAGAWRGIRGVDT